MWNIAIMQDSLNHRLSMHDAGKNARSWGRSPSQGIGDAHRPLSTLQIFVGSDGKGAPPKGEAHGTCNKQRESADGGFLKNGGYPKIDGL